jgi:murein DD-endopeptidase MepM/ murein hydrolase activator NlpD
MGTNLIRAIGLTVSAVSLVVGTGVGKVEGSGGNEYPIPANFVSSFAVTHSGYPATDIFAKCGANVVAPVSGLVNSLRRFDLWNKETDNPWLRGGKFVSIVGIDGVRYYLAHLETIVDSLNVGSAVHVGQRIGTVGKTGRAGACHVHFGISPQCTNPEWWVRRGVIWPAKFLKSWRSGVDKSPAIEIQRWQHNNLDVCLDKRQLPWSSN